MSPRTLLLAAALHGHLWHAIEGASFVLSSLGAVAASDWIRARRMRISREAQGTKAEGLPAGDVDGGEPVSAALLQVAFIGLLVAAATHLAVMPDHFRQSWIYGTFFVVVATGQVTTAILLIARPSRRVIVTALTGSATVVALWAVSRFVGVPIGPDHGAPEGIGVLDVLATVAELMTAASCALGLRGGRPAPAWRWALWPLQLRAMLVATGVAVALAATFAPRS